MKMVIILLELIILSGCAFNVSVTRTRELPVGTSSFVETFRRPPNGKEYLDFAKIEAQGNNWQNASDCESKLLTVARELGGNGILMQPESYGLGQGARCSGIVYKNIKDAS